MASNVTSIRRGNDQARTSATRDARARWWTRRGSKERGFWYADADGTRITDESALERIRALVLPPAWRDVRISPRAGSKLQAVGVDASGRLQYKYHERFASQQKRKKYEKISRFGRQLAALRRRTEADLNGEGLPKERVIAVVVRLIDALYFRVGSEKSVAQYKTFGVTTLRNRHLRIDPDGRMVFSFVGKHHVAHTRVVEDRELAAVVREIKALRGPHLFQYCDESGRVHPVTARDVNEYIKSATSGEFSAKDFRTWGGSLLAAVELSKLGRAEKLRDAKRNVVRAVKRVAERLGNTPAVCRSSYIHPVVIEKYMKGVTLDGVRRKAKRARQNMRTRYDRAEAALLALISRNSRRAS